ncbi:glycoside hydrolase family 28 protein [Sphingomonas montana]|uniref:rhamnogalacturonidase n=1 Tax=Sphingomonas montana TaxID=1843236 RepID=UPI00096DC8AE|nr:glycosyl hydrolase family 28-related protein [Sphingomonas montana]
MIADRRTVATGLIGTLAALFPFPAHARTIVDVRRFGAAGDGVRLDTDAINRAIAAVSRAGGGTVRLTAGRYLSFSIRLRDNVTLLIDRGATLQAADPAVHAGRYDLPEPNRHDLYQDFGHSHWHNSLIWGDGVRNVAILGPGTIDGRGLTRNGPGARWRKGTGERPLSMRQMSRAEIDRLEPDARAMDGLGNKAIALKNARNVRLADLTIRDGGHFAVLATGVDDMAIERLTIDTQRDGIDLDCVRRVRVTGCTVNTPNDDAIVLKSSWALGETRPSEDVLIADCRVSGYDPGTLLDGRRLRTQAVAPDRDRVTGRIKLGTESTGGYRNVTIRDCRFDRCRGLALEAVDGGIMEDIAISGLRMHEVTTAPLFVRLGDRRRGPDGTGIGAVRRIAIRDVTATGIDHRYAATLAGLAGNPVTDIALSDVRLVYAGGGTAADAARAIPDVADAYPEPSMFGVSPAWGLFARHVRGLDVRALTLETATPDARPPILLADVAGATALATPRWSDRIVR